MCMLKVATNVLDDQVANVVKYLIADLIGIPFEETQEMDKEQTTSCTIRVNICDWKPGTQRFHLWPSSKSIDIAEKCREKQPSET